MEPKKIPYRFRIGESGVFIEIYLPKKALYQGTLYNTLTSGFTREHVVKHFRDNKGKISSLLRKNYPELVRSLDSFCDNYENVFTGYSMYEVDGVFFDADEEDPKKQITEERTQVIRLIFKPNLSRFTKKMKYKRFVTLLKTFLQAPLSHFDYYLKYYEKSHTFGNAELTEQEIELLKYLAKWVQTVVIFLIGYVVYEICKEISFLIEKEKLPKHEKEIMVTSFWNLLVYKIDLDEELLKGERYS